MSRDNTFTIAQFKKSIAPIVGADDPKNRLPVLIRGDHGIGKSDLVYQIGKEEFGEDNIIERRASQMVEGDLIGMPQTLSEQGPLVQGLTKWLISSDFQSLDGAPESVQKMASALSEEGRLVDTVREIKNECQTEYTDWRPPEWLYRACQEPHLLFLDELDRAMMSVRQGIFELTGSRKLYGNELHPETQIFAAINGGEGVTDYTVGEMDPAELDRWFTIDLHPSEEEWLNWAADEDINRYVFEFISDNPDMLEHDGTPEPGKVYPSRRSWHRYSELMDQEFGDEKPKAEWAMLHGRGHLGRNVSMNFARWLQEYEESFSIDEVLENKNNVIEEVESLPGTIQNDIVRQFDAKYSDASLADNPNDDGLTRDQIVNFGRFILNLRDEVAVTAFQTVEDLELRKTLFELGEDELPEIADHREELEGGTIDEGASIDTLGDVYHESFLSHIKEKEDASIG
jgi:hypothetical protein